MVKSVLLSISVKLHATIIKCQAINSTKRTQMAKYLTWQTSDLDYGVKIERSLIELGNSIRFERTDFNIPCEECIDHEEHCMNCVTLLNSLAMSIWREFSTGVSPIGVIALNPGSEVLCDLEEVVIKNPLKFWKTSLWFLGTIITYKSLSQLLAHIDNRESLGPLNMVDPIVFFRKTEKSGHRAMIKTILKNSIITLDQLKEFTAIIFPNRIGDSIRCLMSKNCVNIISIIVIMEIYS